MWPTLARFDPDVEWLHRGERWSPMLRVIRRLNAKDDTLAVIAHTSHDSLGIGLSPEYVRPLRFNFVSLSQGEEGQFQVDDWRKNAHRLVRRVCWEVPAERLVDALVLRMDLTRDDI